MPDLRKARTVVFQSRDGDPRLVVSGIRERPLRLPDRTPPDRPPNLLEHDHPVTRQAALARLDAFVPYAGRDYASARNFDHGPGRHDAVSRLSAALARRSVSEVEVLGRVLAQHRDSADTFVREVFWRSYFRGWLEARPVVWHGWLAALDRIDARLAHDDGLAARHLAALRGETGIDCFDHWMHELAQTGYLHNWARIQIASIWMFTLGLPWELGARHFLATLIDADTASNTLSWRWVAGLHTLGKAYLADAERIARMTGGRFAPTGLATRARIADATPHPPPLPPREPLGANPDLQTMLWITPGDCSLETEAALAHLRIVGVAIIVPGAETADHGPNADRIALDDALARAATHWQIPAWRVAGPDALVRIAVEAGARQVVTGRVGVGHGLDMLIAARAASRRAGIALAEHVRAWDRQVWPHATRGFFALRDHIPHVLAQAGLDR